MPAKLTKNISLTPHLNRFIEDKVRSGLYQSASEVVREGLRVLEQRDAALAEMRRSIEMGWRDSEAGRTRDGETVMKKLRRQLAGNVSSSKRARPRNRTKP